jgi:hypothetical protein
MRFGLNRQRTDSYTTKEEGSDDGPDVGQQVYAYGHGKRDSDLAFHDV